MPCRFPGHAVPASSFTGQPLSAALELHRFGTEAFTAMACARPVYLSAVLEASFAVVWSDSDSAWLRSFLTEAPQVACSGNLCVLATICILLSLHTSSAAALASCCGRMPAQRPPILAQGLDYVGVDDSEQNEPERDTDNACTCLMYLNPTSAAKALLRDWHGACLARRYNNQQSWNQVGLLF